MRVLSEADVETLIAIPEAIALAAEAYRLQARGAAPAPVRGDLRRDDPRAGCLVLVGAHGPDHLAVKSNVYAYPDGPDAPRLWNSLLALWDWRRAEPRALIAARGFNDHRTAAGFAAGADRLATSGAATLAVFGAGKSAPLAVRYMKAVRPSLGRVMLVGRDPGRVAALAGTVGSWPDFAGVEVAVASAQDAARVADIIVTVTTSETAVFPGACVKPGACIVLGGANRPGAREADDALMRRADIYLDARAGATEKAGDIRLALASGALLPEQMRAEIGACTGPLPLSPGRDVLVFKSMGLAIQDVVLAQHLVERAEERGIGQVVDLAGG
jgi:ornithine cyclodeaminase